MSHEQRQIDALTGIRGIAAWLIVFYHIRASIAASVPPFVTSAFAKGYLAVDLFFVLSGFVIWLTYSERFAGDSWRAAPDFLRRRFARVYPLHFVILVFTILFAIAIQLSGRPLPSHYVWAELPLHFALVQNWGFTQALAWNDPAWSISTEIAAYLLFPVIAAVLVRWRPPALAAAFIIATLCLALDRIFAAQGLAFLGDDIPRTGLVRCVVEFLCGVLVSIVWQAKPCRTFMCILGTAGGVAALSAIAGYGRETLAVPLAFSALVLIVAQTSAWRGNPLSHPILLKLGEISYSTYLAHFLLWTAFKLAFVSDPAAVPLPAIAIYLALTFIVSLALYRFVERPGRSLTHTPSSAWRNEATAP